MKNGTLIFLTLFVLFFEFVNAQIVNIPDSNFKAALLNNSSINTNGDGEIQVSEATAFTGEINIQGGNISDLTGIEALLSITGLNCSFNQLTNLNLSANTLLNFLNCQGNQLALLDLSANTALIELDCELNQLTMLDLSSNTYLNLLDCAGNQLTNLNLPADTNLTTILCGVNQLTSLDVSANTYLDALYCDDSPITNLNLSSNAALTVLSCINCQLTDLNLSNNIVLKSLNCSSNELTSLNVKNGNNNNLTGFIASYNPNLFCIEVDDSVFMNTNWSSGKDSTAIFSENCSTGINNYQLPTTNFQLYPNPFSHATTFSFENSLTQSCILNVYSITGQLVRKKNIRTSSFTFYRENMNAGIYFYEFSNGKKVLGRGKMMVE